jgi:hypothetical protein
MIRDSAGLTLDQHETYVISHLSKRARITYLNALINIACKTGRGILGPEIPTSQVPHGTSRSLYIKDIEKGTPSRC